MAAPRSAGNTKGRPTACTAVSSARCLTSFSIAQKLTGQPGVTGTITVRLHRPTPLCTELQLVGRVKEVKGRKNLLEGEIRANGVVTASCEALFIHVSRDRFRQLLAGG